MIGFKFTKKAIIFTVAASITFVSLSIQTKNIAYAASSNITATVKGENVPVKLTPFDKSEIITTISSDKQIIIKGKYGDFVVVKLEDYGYGYINIGSVVSDKLATVPILTLADLNALTFTDTYANKINNDFVQTVGNSVNSLSTQTPIVQKAATNVAVEKIAVKPVQIVEPASTITTNTKVEDSTKITPTTTKKVIVFTSDDKLLDKPLVEEFTSVIGDTYAKVHVDNTLNLRESSSTSSNIIAKLSNGESVKIITTSDKWAKVSAKNGQFTGYVSTEFIDVSGGDSEISSHQDVAYTNELPASDKANAIVEYAKQFIGTPYQWAGDDLRKGVDCSGFVTAVLGNFNIKVDRSSSAMAKDGVKVAKSDLQVGDLIFFDTTGVNDGNISHVAIYIGNGKYIHSTDSKKTYGVTISSLNNEYSQRTYVSASRVIK